MNLNEKSLTELVDLHNDANPAHPIKKFRDKKTALDHVEALLASANISPTALYSR